MDLARRFMMFMATGIAAELIIATLSVIGTVIGTGFVVYRLIRADLREFRAEVAEDRRASQAAMDTFRQEMQRLAERQSRVEGRFDAPPSGAD